MTTDKARMDEVLAVGTNPMAALRAKLAAELAEVKPKAENLWNAYLAAKEEAERRSSQWLPLWNRCTEIEQQIATLNALAEQLEQKSPGDQPGADEPTTAKDAS